MSARCDDAKSQASLTCDDRTYGCPVMSGFPDRREALRGCKADKTGPGYVRLSLYPLLLVTGSLVAVSTTC